MNIKKKLHNPFVLIAQGFIAGSVIFYATMPDDIEARRPSAPVQSARSADVAQV